ncbi:MAG: beta-galactosidase [Clostridium sp.]|nr:beta-galactosidase [Clostridium sp.]
MLYGAQYYRPPFPGRECWRRDLAHMRELGFNCVKHWAVWNWIEREPGKFDFSELDELVALSKEYGLQVVVNTVPEGAPYWTWEGDEEDLYRTADGQRVAYGGPANLPSGGWPGLCMDKPEFAALTAAFIEETARHFADEPGVIAIDVWNEPHLEPMYDYRSNMLCYCRHSRAAFRRWLREKYASLDELNRAWYRTYVSWDQVEPPPRFGTWADMLDWRRFWLDNLAGWLRLRVAAAKRGAPGKKVQTHVAYSGILGNRIVGGLGNELGDEFLLAREVDWFGLSSFPKWLMGPDNAYRHLIHNEMVAEAARGKLFYQVELQGGAGKPGLLGGEVPTPEDVKIWNWNTAAAGGKGTVYWQYAPEPAGVESPGFGLTGFAGQDTPRSLAAAESAGRLNRPELEGAVRIPAVNAVYVSRSSDLLTFASERREEMYAGSLSGVFRAAYERGIPARFLHEDYIEDLETQGVRFLYLPLPLVLSERETEILARFVEHGGTLVSEACPGLYRPDGLLDQEGSALKRLFGLTHREIQGIRDWGMVCARMEDGVEFAGKWYRQLADPGADVRVLARFEDGEAAVTERPLGKGRAVWIGTYPSYYHEHGFELDGARMRDGTRDLLTRFMSPGGYGLIDSVKLSGFQSGEISLAPFVRLHRSGGGHILTAVNHLDREARITVHFKEEQQFQGGAGKRLEFTVPAQDGICAQWDCTRR